MSSRILSWVPRGTHRHAPPLPARFALLVLCGLLLTLVNSCKHNATSPTPVVTTTTTSTPPLPPAAPFSWDRYRGFSAFALLAQPDDEVLRTLTIAAQAGWNTPRICAETEFWDGTYPYLRQPRDLDRLREILDLLRTLPSLQVFLIANCTLKGPVAIEEQSTWVRQVAEVASQYPNVAIEVVNEGTNCRGRGWGPYCPMQSEIAQWIQSAKRTGVLNVTLDDSFCWGDDSPRFQYSAIGATHPDFHPCRSKNDMPWDPSKALLRRIADANGPFVLSETVAYADFSGDCQGLRTCDKQRIRDYIDRCAAVSGCRFTFHSEAGLAGSGYTWFPQAK